MILKQEITSLATTLESFTTTVEKRLCLELGFIPVAYYF